MPRATVANGFLGTDLTVLRVQSMSSMASSCHSNLSRSMGRAGHVTFEFLAFNSVRRKSKMGSVVGIEPTTTGMLSIARNLGASSALPG